MMALLSAFVSRPIFSSMVACAMEQRTSCRQSRWSKEIDSENAATSAAGPLANRPLLERGFFKARDFREGVMGGQMERSSEARRKERKTITCVDDFRPALSVEPNKYSIRRHGQLPSLLNLSDRTVRKHSCSL